MTTNNRPIAFTTLKNGKAVVAHKGGKFPGAAKQYRSWTAAWNACCKLNVGTKIWQSPASRVFYVVVLTGGVK